MPDHKLAWRKHRMKDPSKSVCFCGRRAVEWNGAGWRCEHCKAIEKQGYDRYTQAGQARADGGTSFNNDTHVNAKYGYQYHLAVA